MLSRGAGNETKSDGYITAVYDAQVHIMAGYITAGYITARSIMAGHLRPGHITEDVYHGSLIQRGV